MAYKGPFIWGNVYDDNGKPIEGSLVRLMSCEEALLQPPTIIMQTKSDSNGYYEFELSDPPKENYRILISASECPKEVRQKRRNNICYY